MCARGKTLHTKRMKFEMLTLTVETAVFRDVMPYNLIDMDVSEESAHLRRRS
jgi:hypothetical protein